jgi:3',5'-cyclic AMP phosphodiesterase CpdA
MFIKVEDIDLHAAIPRQVHLALTGDPHEMTVMWATRTINVLSIVEVWPVDRPHRKRQIRGNIATLEGSPTVMHTVKVKGLHQGMKYAYRVGDPTIDTWCREYWFETRHRKAPQTRFVALGDLDLQEDGTRRNIEFLKNHILEYDMLIILGDICYKWGDALDEIGEALEPIAAIRPTMVLPGNHEYEKRDDLGFHAFNTRWHMPENGYLNQWYSFNAGNLHIVALSTEDSLEPTSPQGRWLLRDLKVAAERGDWTLLVAHKTPVGSANKKWLRNKAHVLYQDLQHYLPTFQIKLTLWGHIHAYERTHPIEGVVYTTIGVGGARLDTEWLEPAPEWSACRQTEFGAAFFQFDHVLNQISMQFRSAITGETLDSFCMSTLPFEVAPPLTLEVPSTLAPPSIGDADRFSLLEAKDLGAPASAPAQTPTEIIFAAAAAAAAAKAQTDGPESEPKLPDTHTDAPASATATESDVVKEVAALALAPEPHGNSPIRPNSSIFTTKDHQPAHGESGQIS